MCSLAEQWAGTHLCRKLLKYHQLMGDLDGLGRITLTVGTKEVLYPDALNLSQLLECKRYRNYDFIPEALPIPYLSSISIPERRRFLYHENIINCGLGKT